MIIEYFVEDYINGYGWVRAYHFPFNDVETAKDAAKQLAIATERLTRVIKSVSDTEVVIEYKPSTNTS